MFEDVGIRSERILITLLSKIPIARVPLWGLTEGMADEQIIYRGNPSVVTILGTLLLNAFLLIAIGVGIVLVWQHLHGSPVRYAAFALLLIPLVIFLIKWIALKFLTYEITSERIKITKGILSKRTDELELYRVKDTSLIEPLALRMFGAGNILVITSDAGTPQLELKGIPGAKDIREKLRESVEECRVRKGARVMEME